MALGGGWDDGEPAKDAAPPQAEGDAPKGPATTEGDASKAAAPAKAERDASKDAAPEKDGARPEGKSGKKRKK
jgi:hypothetical protein